VLPISIVYKVLNTNGSVVLHDAARSGEFARDAYLQSHAPQSVLCVPLARHGKLEGAIYMENRLAAEVFTEDRIEVIQVLAAQASISSENAKLYDDQQRLIEAQRRFVPSQFLESLAHRDIARVSVGEHVLKTMSVMFADLRGFTTLSEGLEPRGVIELLNRYFSHMERPIAKLGGVIDSFSDDEIMALFEGAADAAVRAGVAMWHSLDDFNRRSSALGQPVLHMGIGVNTGPVVLGTVGSQNRIQCTVFGDTVNLASRIEQLTKFYGGRLLIGEQTYSRLDKNAYAIRLVDRVAVKGKSAEVDLYEVIDAESAERRAAKFATREAVKAAMNEYFQGRFKSALALFARIHTEDPDDAVPAHFIDRCSRHLQEAAPRRGNWQETEKLLQK
jgi:class 3 adenylate cyclase